MENGIEDSKHRESQWPMVAFQGAFLKKNAEEDGGLSSIAGGEAEL
jgi:hypothetical protein